MKKIILLSVIIFCLCQTSFAQQPKCPELLDKVIKNCSSVEYKNCLSSSLLTTVAYYTYLGEGFIVANKKADIFDYKGTPQLFCNISSHTWNQFLNKGINHSWEESYQSFLKSSNCECKDL